MTTTTLSQSDLLDPGIRRVYNDEAKMFPDEWQRFVHSETMGEPFITDYKMAFLGLIPQKPEGQAVTYDDPIPGTTLRYDPTPYGLGFRVTKEMLRDDRYSQIRRTTSHMARSVKQSLNILGASAYNNAFSTSFVGFTAGEALVETGHALLGGGTYDNAPSTAATLSVAALQAASISMEKTVSERGFNTPIMPNMLVIPTDLKYIAVEILKTPEVPFSADNTINSIRGEFGFKVWHFLTDTNNWFLISADHDIKTMWRDKPEMSSGDDFDTGDSKHKVYFRFMESRFGDWRGIHGSNPS